ncbi:MAG: roadblock/LC7 domain-containing protein [Candidatus Latescibacterota bacterium]
MDPIENALETFVETSEAIGAMVVGRDGLVLCRTGGLGEDVDAIGALASSALKMPESLAEQLDAGNVVQVAIQLEQGLATLEALSDSYFLVVVAGMDANLGLIRYAVKRHKPELLGLL